MAKKQILLEKIAELQAEVDSMPDEPTLPNLGKYLVCFKTDKRTTTWRVDFREGNDLSCDSESAAWRRFAQKIDYIGGAHKAELVTIGSSRFCELALTDPNERLIVQKFLEAKAAN